MAILLALLIQFQHFIMHITLAVTSLFTATAFHLSMLSSIPSTRYLTFAYKIMIEDYAVFLYKLASSAHIMRLVNAKKP